MYFTDIMVEVNKEEFEIKEERVSIMEEILPSSTVNLHKDHKNMEYTETQGKFNNF